MKPPLSVVKFEALSILQQLKWEEALLRADNRNWCFINHGSHPAIVMGISGDPLVLIDQEKIKKAPIPVIRRFSGGGTVVIDHHTIFITFIIQSCDLKFQPFPKNVMDWTEQLYRPLFEDVPFDLKENDYTIQGKKWGGNAQAITKDRWIHHSSLLWNYNPDLMEYLQHPPKMPTYRNNRPHHEFLCKLGDHFKDKHIFEQQLLQELSNHFTLNTGSQAEIELIEKLPHRKTTQLI